MAARRPQTVSAAVSGGYGKRLFVGDFASQKKLQGVFAIGKRLGYRDGFRMDYLTRNSEDHLIGAVRNVIGKFNVTVVGANTVYNLNACCHYLGRGKRIINSVRNGDHAGR